MENKEIKQLAENEKLVEAYFVGAKRVPNKKEYYELDLVTFNPSRREQYNSAYTWLHLYPKMETVPTQVVPPFSKVLCVFEDLEEGAKPRFIRFYDLEGDLNVSPNKQQ